MEPRVPGTSLYFEQRASSWPANENARSFNRKVSILPLETTLPVWAEWFPDALLSHSKHSEDFRVLADHVSHDEAMRTVLWTG